MISLGDTVNSFGSHDHTLCLPLIPKSTKSELIYTGNFEEGQEAVMQMLEICFCSYTSCQFCTTLFLLLRLLSVLYYPGVFDNVMKYMNSDEYKASKIPVDTAQCYQIQGWGNLSHNAFGIDLNVCKCRVADIVLCYASIAAAN